MFARFLFAMNWRATTRVVPTVRRRLHRIVRNSLWLSLTHYATPPFPQKSRSARLFGCKRPHNGSLSLPTFADCGQPHFQPPLCKGCGSPVETSAFNAEAPTEPAGETVGCRRQLGGIVRLTLYEFVKSLSHFFVPKKRQLSLQGSL